MIDNLILIYCIILLPSGEEKANSIFSDSAIGTSIITAEGDTKVICHKGITSLRAICRLY